MLDRDINLNVKAQIHYTLWKSAWDEKETPHLNNKWESSLDLSPRVAGGDVWCPGGEHAVRLAKPELKQSKEADEKLSWKKQVLWQKASSLSEIDFIS